MKKKAKHSKSTISFLKLHKKLCALALNQVVAPRKVRITIFKCE